MPFCKDCGTQIADTKFCGGCGRENHVEEVKVIIKKKEVSQKQKEHLAKARAKSLETRQKRKKQKTVDYECEEQVPQQAEPIYYLF